MYKISFREIVKKKSYFLIPTQLYFSYRNILFLVLFEKLICRCFPQMNAIYINLAIILKNMLACAKKTFLKNMLCKLKFEKRSYNFSLMYN